jgi:hypothetical protein
MFSAVPRLTFVILTLFAFTSGSVSWAQQRFNTRVVVAVVPLIGKGTAADPRRPMFAPAPSERDQDDALDFECTLTDDGKSAIVVFYSSRSTEAGWKKLDQIAKSTEYGVRAFERHKHGRDEIEAEFKTHKKNFDLTAFLGSVDAKAVAK